MTFGECLSAFLLEQIFVVCTVPSSTIRGKQHSVKQDQNVVSFGMSDTNFRSKFIVWNTFKNRYDTTRIGISFLRNWSKNLANMCLFFSDGSNYVRSSMFDRSKPKIGCSSSITIRWTRSSLFDVRKMMFESVRWVI